MKTLITCLFFGIHFFPLTQDLSRTLQVYFEHNASEISTSSKSKIDSLFQTKGQIKIVRILAYCDPTGSEEYNYLLAKRRLSNVSKSLSKHTKELGEQIAVGEKYLDKTEAEKQHHLLRRVEIHYSISRKETANETTTSNSFESIDLNPAALATSAPIVLKIQFIPGLSILLAESNQEIENLYSFLSKNEKLHASIRGHVCCDNDYPLSLERAREVYRILVEKGISPSRLDYNGFSNTIPFVIPEITDDDRQQNRRVDVIFTIQK